jgi:hypothetical protein
MEGRVFVFFVLLEHWLLLTSDSELGLEIYWDAAGNQIRLGIGLAVSLNERELSAGTRML